MKREYSSMVEQRCSTPGTWVRFLVLAPLLLGLASPVEAGRRYRVETYNPYNSYVHGQRLKAERQRGRDYDRTWAPIPQRPTVIIPSGPIVITPR